MEDDKSLLSQYYKIRQKCRKNTLLCLGITSLVAGMNLVTLYIGYYYGIHENHHHLNDGSCKFKDKVTN